ncbi:MAG: PIG-L family deacetylase [Chloroflexota bacterium]
MKAKMEKVEGLSLMAIFAHPDDESFGNGGTLSRYAEEGVFTSLLTATRGEAGEISDPALAQRDNLGQVREQELKLACSILGVRDLRFLDYVDGTLQSIDQQECTGRMVRAIRELKPQVIFTFGPDGVYGHPDHVAVSQMATDAFNLAGDNSAYPEQFRDGLKPWTPLKLYYVAPPRERFQRMGEFAAQLLPHTAWESRDWTTFGVPEKDVTSCVDVGRYVDTKLAAIAAHQTQLPPDHPFAMLPGDVLREFFREECYVLAESRVPPSQGRETDLFAGVGQATLASAED